MPQTSPALSPSAESSVSQPSVPENHLEFTFAPKSPFTNFGLAETDQNPSEPQCLEKAPIGPLSSSSTSDWLMDFEISHPEALFELCQSQQDLNVIASGSLGGDTCKYFSITLPP